MKKMIRLVIAAAAATISMSATAYAAGWQHNATGWWWQNEDGTWPAGSWQWLDGNKDGVAECYYFNGDGYLLCNTKTPDNYEVNADGAWVVNNAVQTQALPPSSQPKQQTQNQSQTPANGWNKENNSWKYYINGKSVTDWRKISGKRYYFDENGIMLTGFHDLDGCSYYFNDSGDLQTKSFNRNGIHYEVNSDGVITDEQDLEDWKYNNQNTSTGNSSGSGSTGNANNTSGAGSQSTSEDTSNYAWKVFELVNEERQKAGKSALTWDDSIVSCAQIRAEELTQLYSHSRPDGSQCFTVFSENGVSHGYAGENIAAGQSTPAQVMNAWMNSSGHKANILNSNYKKLGVGFYKGSGQYTYYWVQLFTD